MGDKVEVMAPVESTGSAWWSILPSILWFILVCILVVMFRRELRITIRELAWRLRSGAAVKIASVELAQIEIAKDGDVRKSHKAIGARADTDQVREREREDYRTRVRDVMLVHRLYRSREQGELYDLIIYVIPHKNVTLAGVTRVEYFLGRYWHNRVYTSTDRSRGFAIATAAYGPMLCTAEVHFNDGTSTILHRYIDFEMGGSAPARSDDG